MASSNRVFVSPGVYTSEKDLTFVAQSVGVTTLGLVGETLKGPAFEPILITNFDEFRTYFGPSSPIKYGNGNPKYELPYVAKSYLQESNQLFVTRVLGLTGYRAGKTYGIKSLGGVNITLTGYTSTTGLTMDPLDITGSTIYGELSGKTSFDGVSITDYIETEFSGYTTGETGTWFVIGKPDADDVAGLTASDEILSPLTGVKNESSNHQKEWYNVFFDNDPIDVVYSYLFVWNVDRFDVTRYEYDAELNQDYDNIIVAALRSRGSYSVQTLNLEVSGNTSVDINEISGVDIELNPLGEFTLNVTGSTGGAKSFTCSLDTTSTKYITKVLGSDVFDKSKSDFPIYVHESYPNLLKSAFEKGFIRGLDVSIVVEDDGSNFIGEWGRTLSPTVVSEVRGGEVSDLFEVITISDGEAANFQVKITIQGIDLESGDFDLIVRDFNDTDDNIVVLEKFSRCNMNPDLPGYVARKVGTSDGEYELRSKYIMLSMSENHPTDAFPCGFKGFVNNGSFGGNSKLGSVIYKTEYYTAGDVTSYEVNGTPVITNGDKVRRVSLGLSSQIGFDRDLFKYKGLGATTETLGFHLSTNASTITGVTYQCTPYDLEGNEKGPLENINNRKFTFTVCGGHDGWDIYRSVRTNSDEFIFAKPTYISGHTTNGGVFSDSVGNSDYYAFLQGFDTFANPEAIDINVFATPGINFFDHSSLVSQAVDIIENERADSLYIINSPNRTSSDEIIDDLDSVSLDSNYSATYWPWIQIRDEDNATQLYIPPTGEVLKNIALTDNVSYPWFAVAGYQRGLVNSIKAFKKLTLDERDGLYKNRINPIATFSDTGTIIWGNKTLQVRESALDRINVRRLLLRARKLISAVAVRLLFEQNDEQVRNEFLRLVNPILESIKKERGLNDFRVTVSNDPEDIDANTLRGKIYIKPTRSLEFIDVEFIITPTGASFENI
jgi:RNA recognition motif-containing protein